MSEIARKINQQWIDSQPAVPCIRRGMIYLAKGEEEEVTLRRLLELGELNNVSGISEVSLAEVAEMEPLLSLAGVTAALFSNNEAIVDPWLLAMTHVYGMEVAGVEVLTRCEVLGVAKEEGRWSVETRRGVILATCVVNCGGNYGDQVENMVNKVVE